MLTVVVKSLTSMAVGSVAIVVAVGGLAATVTDRPGFAVAGITVLSIASLALARLGAARGDTRG